MRNGLRACWWYTLALMVLGLDQLTKHLASMHLEYAQPTSLLPILDLTLRHNTGAAFSFLSDAGGWQRYFFTAIASVVSLVLVGWLYRMPRQERLLALGIGLILGGAMGNLWDRVTLGYVVDFVSVHYDSFYFPAFNVADSAITLGAGCVLFDGFRHSSANSVKAGRP